MWVVVLPGTGPTVPVHAGRDMAPGTLRNILRDTGLTVDELLQLL
jgi:predicted RNA binding protein YcfA (HicA-like mRNA interferase family)